MGVLAMVLRALRGQRRERGEALNEPEVRVLAWQIPWPSKHLINNDAGVLTLMLPTDGGMARRKVRIEGLTSSICLRMTLWSDC